MLFIGKPKGRSKMIFNAAQPKVDWEVCFGRWKWRQVSASA